MKSSWLILALTALFVAPNAWSKTDFEANDTQKPGMVLEKPNALTIYEVGRLVQVQGQVETRGLQQKDFSKITLGEPIWGFSTLKTLPDSRARVTLLDETILVLGPDTELQMTRFLFDGTSGVTFCLFDLKKGEVLLSVAKHPKEARQSSYEIELGNLIVATRGSEFVVSTLPSGTTVSNLGKMPVHFQNRNEKVFSIEPNQKLVLADESLTATPETIDPKAMREPFQWTSELVRLSPGFLPQPPVRITDISNLTIPQPWVRTWPTEDAYEGKPLWYPKSQRELKREAKLKKKQEG